MLSLNFRNLNFITRLEMKTYRLQPHEIGYIKLLHSSFSGIDYATANSIVQMKDEDDAKKLKVIREVQIKTMSGLVSEYIRACLIMKNVLSTDEKVFCVYNPSDDNTKGECTVMTMDEYAQCQQNA